MSERLEKSGPYLERELTLLETNIDDMNPELFPPLMERLFAAGALDCWTTPIIMKRGRPAHLLSVICEPEHQEPFAGIIFRETTTLGIRTTPFRRLELRRESTAVETRFGPIAVKIGADLSGEVLNAAPEFRDCERAAREHDTPLKSVYAAAQSAYDAAFAAALSARRKA